MAATAFKLTIDHVSGTVAPGTRRSPDYGAARIRLYALFLALDGVMMAAAFQLADLIRFGRFVGYGLTTYLVLYPIYAAVALNGNSWSIHALASPRYSAFQSARALVLATAVATVLFFSLKVGTNFSRPVFGFGCALSLLLIYAQRLFVGGLVGKRHGWTFRREIVLLDGVSTDVAANQVVIDAGAEGLRPVSNDPEMLDRLARLVQGSERMVVACSADARQAWARILAGANLDVEILTPELETIAPLGLRHHQGIPTLVVGRGPLRLRERVLKRVFDLAVATAAIILLAPVMIAAAIAVKLTSRGPVLFRQVRMGRGNRLFEVVKFRTMRSACTDSDGTRSVRRGDDRLTKVGPFLRRTSIDELPQLFNVIRGEMSIVGPRPHALGTRVGNQLLWSIDQRYWDRHAIKPGLTGLAQVRGLRGETIVERDLTDRLQADLEYIDGWHIGRDLAIMFRTLGVIVHPNAF
jgi:lipopolysaccharide/colanic/teichoic acid biosynthesis glycosyltransferase